MAHDESPRRLPLTGMSHSPSLLPCASLFALLAAGCPAPSSDDPEGESDEGESGVPMECPVGNGPTMHQDNIDEDELWRAEDGPHLITHDFTIFAAVTVEPCTVVQIMADGTLSIAEGGSLVAAGTEDGVVTFERLDPDSPWSAIEIEGGSVTLEHTILDGGGDPLNRVSHLHGAVIVRGPADATAADPTLTVRHVEIRDSATQGVRLFDQGAFTPDSEDLVVTGSAAHPISTEVDSADGIPTGDYTGNGDDRILLTVVDPVVHDMTLAERGVPYLVGAPNQIPDLRVFVQNGAATLTIEPGVELQFGREGVMRIEPAVGEFPAAGALVAVGTEDAPIVFTSAEPSPAAGDWRGIWFGGEIAPESRMQHVVVEYAGGASNSGSASCAYSDAEPTNDAAIRLFGEPTSQFITNTTIVASARHGIDRGWFGNVVDFRPSNDLEDVARCGQSWPRPDAGACPDPVPCE
jgi:hypothetical protein